MTRPMRETQRVRLIKQALRRGEAESTQKIYELLHQRYSHLKRELRRANLRKRLTKAKQQKKPTEEAIGVDWTTWITLLTLGIKAALVPIAENVYAVERNYWLSRNITLNPLNIDDLIAGIEDRIGRQLSDIGIETHRDVINEIVQWHGSEETFSDLLDRMEKYFSMARAETIARTEASYMASQIADNAMAQLGIDEWNFVLAPESGPYPCIQCIDYAADNPHKRGDPMPPLHPNDRCGVSYVVDLVGA